MPTPGNFVINLSGSDAGNQVVIPAPTAPSFIEVAHFHVTSDRPVTITVRSNPSGEILDVIYATNASGGGLSTPYTYDQLLRCLPGQSLVFDLSAAAGVGGAGKYSVVPTQQVTDWGTPFGAGS